MEIFLKIRDGNILNNNEVVLKQSSMCEYIFSYNQARFIIKEKVSRLQRFLGLSTYYVFSKEDIIRSVGYFKMQGVRKLEINLMKPSRHFFKKIYLIRLFFLIKRAFKIESTVYYYQRKENELRLSSDFVIDEFDILSGCFILLQLNRIGSTDVPLDCDA